MTILEQIVEKTLADVALRQLQCPEAELRRLAESAPAPRDFTSALRARPGLPPRVIAELKKASPSKGLIREPFAPLELAQELEAAGAAALSVLTEPHWFKGSPDYLQTVTRTVTIPALRKDFITDPYQVHEARAWGASAILLIAASLTPSRFAALRQLAHDLGLAVLAEVHDRAELDWILAEGAEIVGINSRDLRTFKTDLNVAKELLGSLPASVIGVAESAIRHRDDLLELQNAGAQAFLIGETLMRAPRPGTALQALILG